MTTNIRTSAVLRLCYIMHLLGFLFCLLSLPMLLPTTTLRQLLISSVKRIIYISLIIQSRRFLSLRILIKSLILPTRVTVLSSISCFIIIEVVYALIIRTFLEIVIWIDSTLSRTTSIGTLTLISMNSAYYSSRIRRVFSLSTVSQPLNYRDSISVLIQNRMLSISCLFSITSSLSIKQPLLRYYFKSIGKVVLVSPILSVFFPPICSVTNVSRVRITD